MPSSSHDKPSTMPKSAQNQENVVPTEAEGALANYTLGEMVQPMADIYGRYTGVAEWKSKDLRQTILSET